MPIIDPLPSGRRLPLMQTIQDAAKLNVQERTTFYVSAYLFQCWLSDLVLANAAQLAEKPSPNARSFQTGEALRGFHKLFGKASDAEFPSLFSDLMEFAACDDPLAELICQSAFTLSVEHDLTGMFLGKRTPPEFTKKPKQLLAAMRATTNRLCDWLDAACQYRTFHEWHIMPHCFDPDPKKRELAYLALGQPNFDLMTEHSQAHWLNHMSAAVDELKNSPKWAVYRQIAKAPPPEPRPWPTNRLDHFLIKLWPLVKHYHWSAVDFLFVLRKVLDTADLAPCPNEQKLIAYCADPLSLRYVGLNLKSKIRNPKSNEPPAYNVALRLCAPEPPDP